MAVVVTGGAGFIGAHLVRLLAARGHQVVTIDRRPHAPTGARVHLVADLADDDRDGRVGDALRAAEAVFHLAGRAGVRDAAPDRERRRDRDNVLAAERVLGTVCRPGCRWWSPPPPRSMAGRCTAAGCGQAPRP